MGFIRCLPSYISSTQEIPFINSLSLSALSFQFLFLSSEHQAHGPLFPQFGLWVFSCFNITIHYPRYTSQVFPCAKIYTLGFLYSIQVFSFATQVSSCTCSSPMQFFLLGTITLSIELYTLLFFLFVLFSSQHLSLYVFIF
jgi:hypothetical protein